MRHDGSVNLSDFLFYADQDVTVYCGDNRVILPLMREESIDCVIASPPYNTAMVGNTKVKASGMMKEYGMSRWVDKMTGGYEDSLPEDQYQLQQQDVLGLLHLVAAPHASLFYNHKDRWRDKTLIDPLQWLSQTAWNLRMRIIWDRSVGTTRNARMFYLQHEYMFWCFKYEWRWNQSAVGHGTVWRIAPQPYKEHSCVFPEALVARCLDAVIAPGTTVLDPYAGSGTVARVARKFGCKSIMIERDPTYCQVIVEGMRQGGLFTDTTTQNQTHFSPDLL